MQHIAAHYLNGLKQQAVWHGKYASASKSLRCGVKITQRQNFLPTTSKNIDICPDLQPRSGSAILVRWLHLHRISCSVSAWIATFVASGSRYYPDFLTFRFALGTFDAVHPIMQLSNGQLVNYIHKGRSYWCLEVLGVQSLHCARYWHRIKGVFICCMSHC